MRIAVDWGSTSFRAYLMDEHLDCVDKRSNGNGVFNINGSFADVFQDACDQWISQDNVTEVLLAGMAGSRNGWRETSYSLCPVNASAHRQASLEIDSDFDFSIHVLPGVQTSSPCGFPDVMRGEEVQLFGALTDLNLKDAVVCLPGTHSKWVDMNNNNVKSFATLMTGEVFALIREHSSVGVLVNDTNFDEKSFLQGVSDQRSGTKQLKSSVGLTHSLFSVRARAVSNSLQVDSGYSYLSGLLLADEITTALSMFDERKELVLISDDKLSRPYQLALNAFGLSAKTIDSEHAFLKGMQLLMQ